MSKQSAAEVFDISHFSVNTKKTRITAEIECPIHGHVEFETFEHLPHTCPMCDAEKAQRDLSKKLRFVSQEQRLLAAGIPKRFLGKTVNGFTADGLTQREVKQKAAAAGKNLAEILQSGKNLIFTGSSGAGKTHLACALATLASNLNRSVRYTTHEKYIVDCLSSDSLGDTIRKYTSPDLLIIDELLLRQKHTETAQQHLNTLVQERYDDQKSTIFISNHSLEKIREMVGDIVYSRMIEDSTLFILFLADNFRLRDKE